TPWTQDAEELTVEPSFIRDLHAAVLRPHEIEAAVGKGQVERMPAAKVDLLRQPHACRQQCTRAQIIGGQIEYGHMRPVLHGEHACRSAQTATYIECAPASRHLRLAGQSARRVFATTMKLVQRRQRLGGYSA